MSNVLISGGAGFIGSNTALALIKEGYTVTILDNLSPQVHGPIAQWPVPLMNTCKLIKGNVRNREDWLRALEGIDVIFHFAGETGTGQSMYSISNYCEVNVLGTAILSDILINESHKIKKIILSSSRAIYGEGAYKTEDGEIVFPDARSAELLSKGEYKPKLQGYTGILEPIPTSEDARLKPASIYGITKLAQEQMLTITCSSLNISFFALRYQNVYGPGQSLKNPYTGVLSVFSSLISQDGTIDIFEDGFESRDFVYIDDAVNSSMLALKSSLSGYYALNIGSGVCTTMLDVVKSIKEYMSKKVDYIISGHFRLGDIRTCCADLTRSSKILKYIPTTSFKKGFNKLLNWTFKQPVSTLHYESSLDEMRQKNLLRGKVLK